MRRPQKIAEGSEFEKVVQTLAGYYDQSCKQVIKAVHKLKATQDDPAAPLAGASAPAALNPAVDPTAARRAVASFLPKLSGTNWADHAAPRTEGSGDEWLVSSWGDLPPWVGAIFPSMAMAGPVNWPLSGMGGFLYHGTEFPAFVALLCGHRLWVGKHPGGITEWLNANDGRAAAVATRRGDIWDMELRGPAWLWVPPGYHVLFVHAGGPSEVINFAWMPWVNVVPWVS